MPKVSPALLRNAKNAERALSVKIFKKASYFAKAILRYAEK